MKLIETVENNQKLLTVDAWSQKNIFHGFHVAGIDFSKVGTQSNGISSSTISNNSIPKTQDDALANWQTWADKVYKDKYTKEKYNAATQVSTRLLLLTQVHGDKIIELTNDNQYDVVSKNTYPEADGWLFNAELLKNRQNHHPSAELSTSKLCFGIKTADCIPVLLLGKTFRASLHCGWKSAVKGILLKTLNLMLEYGENISDIQIACGPGAQSCSFEVGEEVVEQFREAYRKVEKNFMPLSMATQEIAPQNRSNEVAEKKLNEKKYFISIPELLRVQAEYLGITKNSISMSEICTIQNLECYSFRRQGENSGRQVSFIS